MIFLVLEFTNGRRGSENETQYNCSCNELVGWTWWTLLLPLIIPVVWCVFVCPPSVSHICLLFLATGIMFSVLCLYFLYFSHLVFSKCFHFFFHVRNVLPGKHLFPDTSIMLNIKIPHLRMFASIYIKNKQCCFLCYIHSACIHFYWSLI